MNVKTHALLFIFYKYAEGNGKINVFTTFVLFTRQKKNIKRFSLLYTIGRRNV